MFLDKLREHAGTNGAMPALESRGRSLNYADVVERIDAVSARLSASGVGEGTVVGLSVRDEMDHLIACMALLNTGASQVTLATFDSVEARESLAAAAGVELILCDHPDLGLPNRRSTLWSEILDRGADAVSSQVGSLLLRTSGTTSDGKIVGFDQEQLALQARDVDQYSGQRYLRPASVEHNNGKRHRLYCLFAGGTNVFRTSADNALMELCRDLRVTIVDLSLMHAEDLVRQDSAETFRNVVVRTAGSALPFSLRQQIQGRVSRRLFVRYGATECGTISMAGPEDHGPDEVVGLPAPGVNVEIVDATGTPVPSGASGQIRIRAPGMARGYRNSPLESERRFINGWFWPGDVGRLRSDGRLIVEGRSDEMMILNGINIFPQEIERVLELHPAVKAAAALPLASPVHGQIPVAAVELERGAAVDVHELEGFARQHLGLRAPRRVMILEALPRAAEGKLLRRALMAKFQSRQGTQ